MKLTTFVVTSFVLLTAAHATPQNANIVDARRFYLAYAVGFTPIEPILAKSKVEVNQNGIIVTKDIRTLTSTETLDFLADTLAQVYVSKVESGSNLSFLGNSIARKKGTYAVYMDYIKYFVEDANDNINKIGRFRTGVGLRVVATVTTKKNNVNLGGLLKIGLAASSGQLIGSLQVRTMGVTSTEIDNLLPGLLSTIDEGAIQSVLESMAAIKTKFRDSDTVINPRHLAIEYSGSLLNSDLRNAGSRRNQNRMLAPSSDLIRAPSIR